MAPFVVWLGWSPFFSNAASLLRSVILELVPGIHLSIRDDAADLRNRLQFGMKDKVQDH